MSQNLNADFLGKPQLDYEAWRDSLQKVSARYNAEDIEPSAFTGWVRPIEAYGFKGVDLGSNAPRVERDHRDVRFDGADHYVVLLPLRGQHLTTQNEQATRLGVRDVLLFDTARPLKFLAQHDGREPWWNLSLNLSRQELVAHLGFEPRGGLVRPGGTPAGRLLFELIQSGEPRPSIGIIVGRFLYAASGLRSGWRPVCAIRSVRIPLTPSIQKRVPGQL